MATLINHLPSARILYGSFSQDIEFPDLPRLNDEAKLLWWKIDNSSPPRRETKINIVSSSPVETTVPDAVATAIAGVSSVVDAIKEMRSLPTSPSLEDMLAQAVRLRGTPENIDEWARRLASDISSLTD